jgi:predicted alpha/beta-fold hydrolase
MVFSSVTGHFHTLVAHFVPSAKLQLDGEKHLVSLEDGDRLCGFLYRGSSSVVVSLFHGLSGDADADYMQRTAALYLAQGHSVFLVNHRNAGAGAGLAKNLYHSGRGEDVSVVVSYLRALLPGKKQITVGFSISGNMVLNLLTGQRGTDLPDGAITVNAPINLAACALRLGSGFNLIYDQRFVRRLIAQKNLPVSPWRKLADIDDRFTAPLSGFKNGRHYYETCSTKNHVQKIKTPAQVMTAADDPFIPVGDYLEAAWPEAVRLKVHPRGGHMGYLRKFDEYMSSSLQELLARI